MQNTPRKALGTLATAIFVLTAPLAGPREAIAQQGQNADNPDRNPWRAELCIVGDFCPDLAPASLTAPADRNIVVDTFSGECSIENGGVFRQMRAELNGTTMHQFLPERSIVGTSHTIYDWNKQTRLVIPASGAFRIAVATVSNLPDVAYCRFYLSGYTVRP